MNEIDTIIRCMFDPGSHPNLEFPYEPVKSLRKAEEDNNAMLELLPDADLRDRLYDSTAEYGAACAVEAFDRGFRAGARLVLQMLHTGGEPVCLNL